MTRTSGLEFEGGSCIFTPSCSKGFAKYKDRALKIKEKIRVNMRMKVGK